MVPVLRDPLSNYAHDRESQRGGAEENDLLASSTSDPKHDYLYKVAVIGTKYKLFSGCYN